MTNSIISRSILIVIGAAASADDGVFEGLGTMMFVCAVSLR